MYKTNLDKLKELMEETNKLFESVKNSIEIKLLNVKNKDINNLSKNIFTIRASSLSLVSLSPEYYNTENQLYRIVSLIDNTQNILSLKRIVEDCIKSGYVNNEGYKVKLNENTLSILKEVATELNIF